MKRKGLLSAISITTGFFLSGFGFTTALGNPLSTICFLLGMALLFFGFLLLIMYIRGT
jgi:hypothetical protein